jgi:hypothetical protein
MTIAARSVNTCIAIMHFDNYIYPEPKSMLLLLLLQNVAHDHCFLTTKHSICHAGKEVATCAALCECIARAALAT